MLTFMERKRGHIQIMLECSRQSVKRVVSHFISTLYEAERETMKTKRKKKKKGEKCVSVL